MAYTKDIGMSDFYKFYKKNAIDKGKPYVNYTTYNKLLKEINKTIRHKIIYEAETLNVPYHLGKLYIRKFHTTYSETNRKVWRVDYKATKEAGKVIYHGEAYGYTFKWNKWDAKLNGKKFYSFKPCRTASRMIADAINNKNLDYYNK